MRPPTRSRASRTMTDLPASARRRAAVSPAYPAPTTQTSASTRSAIEVTPSRLRRERGLDTAERSEIHPHAVPGLHQDGRRERPTDDAVAGAEPLAEGGQPVGDVAHHRGEITRRGRCVHGGNLVTVAERPRAHAREPASRPLGAWRPEHYG